MTRPMPTTAPSHALDYGELVRAYHRGLTEHLRGFDAGLPELAFWVPDEDVFVGVRNLLDALATAGRSDVRLRIAAAESAGIELAAWRALAERYGDAEVTVDPGGVDLHIRALRVVPTMGDPHAPREAPRARRTREIVDVLLDPAGGTFPATIGPHHALEPWSDAPRQHDILPTAGAGEHAGIARRAGVVLGFVVSADGFVRRAGFEGAPHDTGAALLERLCILCEGLPLVEVRDHAILRLEAELRRAPVVDSGIVVPEFAHPAFAFLLPLVRDAVRASGVPLPAVNTYDPGSSPAWRAASDELRRERLAAALETFSRTEALAPDALTLVDLQFGIRVVVALAEDLPREHTGPVLLRLERFLKGEVDGRLEVFLVEERDRNRKRRLAILATATEDRT